jgi:hypothetical protein
MQDNYQENSLELQKEPRIFDIPAVPKERIIAAFVVCRDPVANASWWTSRMASLRKWLASARASKGLSGRNNAQSMWHPHLVAYGLIGMKKRDGTTFTRTELMLIVATHFPEHLPEFKALLKKKT